VKAALQRAALEGIEVRHFASLENFSIRQRAVAQQRHKQAPHVSAAKPQKIDCEPKGRHTATRA